MKRVRLTLDPENTAVHPGFDLLTGGADYLDLVEITNWNVATRPYGILLRVEGDVDRLVSTLEGVETVREVAVVQTDDGAGYVYVSDDGTAASAALFDTFTQGSLLTVPPIRCNGDGTVTYSVVGPASEVQAAIGGVPPTVGITVEEVGGEDIARETVLSELTERQREAVEVALDRGYYDVPRVANTTDVAEELGCAATTAATHLRKAEQRILSSVFRARRTPS